MKIRNLAGIASLLLIAGCTTTTRPVEMPSDAVQAEAKIQREIVEKVTSELETRLHRVGLGVLFSAASTCKNTDYGKGLFFGAGISVGLRGDDQIITHVVKNGPAYLSGLKQGDVIVAVSASPLPMDTDTVFKITYGRGKKEAITTVAPMPKCAYPLVLGPGGEVNAYADGKRIIVSRGMMMFAKDDLELELVIAHELAHNVMNHIDAKTTNYIAGSVLDVIVSTTIGIGTQGTFGKAGAQAFSKDFEAEADYVGLYILASTKAEIEKAPAFWRRMAALHPGAVNHAGTHPATPERFVAMEETIKEIRAKQKAGLPLRPEQK